MSLNTKYGQIIHIIKINCCYSSLIAVHTGIEPVPQDRQSSILTFRLMHPEARLPTLNFSSRTQDSTSVPSVLSIPAS